MDSTVPNMKSTIIQKENKKIYHHFRDNKLAGGFELMKRLTLTTFVGQGYTIKK